MFTWPSGVYTPGVSTITADAMNYLRATIAGQALDIIDGGTYTPVTQTVLTGTTGLKTNFSAVGLQIAGLGGLHILSGSTGYVDSGGFFTVSSGGTATITGALTTSGSGTVTIASGGAITIASGATETINSGGAFTAAAGSTADFSGSVSLNMTQPSSTTDVGANKLYSTNTVKAWAKIRTDGVGGVTVSDGFNIASIAIDATDITVTFAHAFANANYSSTAGAATSGVLANAHTPTTTTLKVKQYDTIGAVVVSPLTNTTLVSLQVIGRQ